MLGETVRGIDAVRPRRRREVDSGNATGRGGFPGLSRIPASEFSSSHDADEVRRLVVFGSVGIRADDLAVRLGGNGPPGGTADRVLDELDVAVGHRHVDAARVGTRGRHGPA